MVNRLVDRLGGRIKGLRLVPGGAERVLQRLDCSPGRAGRRPLASGARFSTASSAAFMFGSTAGAAPAGGTSPRCRNDNACCPAGESSAASMSVFTFAASASLAWAGSCSAASLRAAAFSGRSSTVLCSRSSAVALEGAAQPLGLEETPLVPRLGLLLRGERAVVLGAGHFARSQPRQHRRHHRHDHRGGAEHFAPLGGGHIRLQLVRYLHFHNGWFFAFPVLPPEEQPPLRIPSSCHMQPPPASAKGAEVARSARLPPSRPSTIPGPAPVSLR